MTTRVDISETFSADQLWFRILSSLFREFHYLKFSEQRWKRKFSELKISAETVLIFSETELIQSWTALIFSETTLKLGIFRAKNQRWIRAVSALIFSETELIFSETALKHQIVRAKNQLWISAVSALIFSETELITVEAFWNSSYHSWFSPETTLNIPEFCVFQFLSSPDFLQFFSRET